VLVLVVLSTLWPAGQSAAGAAPSWHWPVGPGHLVTRPFVAPATVYGAGHRGIDIAAPLGATVEAPADGVVHFAGMVVDRPVLSIRHADGLISSFEPVTTGLSEGAVVLRGSAVGTTTAGHCRSPCLHLGVRRYGEYLSPLVFLGGIGPLVLLPTRALR